MNAADSSFASLNRSSRECLLDSFSTMKGCHSLITFILKDEFISLTFNEFVDFVDLGLTSINHGLSFRARDQLLIPLSQ
jgi:hypothetical protein